MSAPLPLRQGNFEAHARHWFPESPVEMSAGVPGGNLLDDAPVLALLLPRLPYSPRQVGSEIPSQINYLHLNF